MHENIKRRMIEFIQREALDGEIIMCVNAIQDRKSADHRDMVAIARGWQINPVNGNSTLVNTQVAPPPPPPPPAAAPAGEVVRAAPSTPPGKKLARIGENARSKIFAMLRNGPCSLDDLGKEFTDHLFTFCQRGEVTYNGKTYSLKEKS